MSNHYAGYAARREGKGHADIGAAVKEGVTKIRATREKELARRGELSTFFAETQAELREKPTFPNDGINNWFGNNITYIKDQMYDDFQLLKKRKMSDSEFRVKHSNLLDAWKKFGMIAKNWNADTEAVIKGSQSQGGEAPALSKLSSFLLDQKLIFTDYENTQLRMGPNGYLTIAEYVTEDHTLDSAFMAKHPKLKEGDMIPGTSQQLDKMVDPQNVISNYYDVKKNSTEIWKKLIKAEVAVVENGVHKISNKTEDRERANDIIANAWETVDADERTVSNFLTALNQKHAYYKDEDKKEEQVTKFIDRDETQNKMKRMQRDLMAQDEFEYIDENGTSSIIKKGDPNSDTYAKEMAAREARGQAEMYMIKAEQNGRQIWQPQFDEKKPIIATEAMTITYNTWDSYSGKITPTTEHFQEGDEVPIGKFQKINAKALFADQAEVYGGGTSRIDTAYETPDQKQKRLAKVKADKTKADKTKVEVVDIYNPVRDIMRFDEEAIDNVIADSSNNISNIEPKTRGEKELLEITLANGDKKDVEYVYDTDGNLDEEATELRIAKAIYKYKDTEKRFKESKKTHGKKEVDPKKPVIKTTEQLDYYDLTDPDSFRHQGVETGSISGEEYSYEDKLKEIQYHGKPDDLRELLQDLSKGQPNLSGAIKIKKDGRVLTATVGDEEFTLSVDWYDDPEDDALEIEKEKMKKTITKILEAHHGVAEEVEEEEEDLDPDKK